MSMKPHCDVCNKVITGRGGHVEGRPLDPGLEDGNKPMDLCLPHYNAYKMVVHEWKKLEQGGMATFPTNRTGSMV